ncbi:hypothetical protein L1987_35449 [Smallanthus sonchifolius]|uniref:Uncharacterized protein n=1 Tax=Smallanthus sonchifolius TaxID=185202 RepID=A0ACB9HW18_9ASTR|nr:hypothetical protein L1987_35449 [Smallanthus sonchifolius]
MVELMKAKTVRTTIAIAEALSFCCATAIVALMLTGAFRDDQKYSYSVDKLPVLSRRPCDEIYVVGEGETLHTISDKCGDPFIVEKNPHIHDPDDVFPGLVIKITPYSSSVA